MDKSLVKIRHERSKKDFPVLRLEEDEYVEFAFRRTKTCLIMILAGISVSLIVVLLAFLLVLMGQSVLDEIGKSFSFIILFTLLAVAIVTGVIALMIYQGNKLFITNKHVIQMVMTSPVVSSINIIDLSSVEDASFRRNSLMENLFHYGTLRLSTVGDETTYTFRYSDVSGEDLKAITKLISDAKKEAKKDED